MTLIPDTNPKPTPSYVPYQKCPICEGIGYTFNTGASTALTSTCTVCNGNKIIPMHILNS